jgi:hypothetical protein
MDDVISIVDAITINELQEVAQKILTDGGLNLAITGPAKKGSLIKESTLRQLLKL